MELLQILREWAEGLRTDNSWTIDVRIKMGFLIVIILFLEAYKEANSVE